MTPEELTLWAHIAAGFLALLAGAGAMATEKGGGRHRRTGRGFLYAMAAVSGASLALYAFGPGFWRLFLSCVAVFSFYFAFSGYRVLSRKRPADDPQTVDWAALGALALASVGMLVLGGQLYRDGASFATVILVFGAIGGAFSVGDLRGFRRSTERGAWVSQHVIRMGAAYIAAVSAFSAVNFLFLPAVVRWLWPTALGVPLLIYFGNKYEERFAPSGG
jgi:uncharacterized membrane protein